MSEIGALQKFINQWLEELKPKVICSCGKKLHNDMSNRLICKGFKATAGRMRKSSANKRHQLEKWGTSKDLIKYDLLFERQDRYTWQPIHDDLYDFLGTEYVLTDRELPAGNYKKSQIASMSPAVLRIEFLHD